MEDGNVYARCKPMPFDDYNCAILRVMKYEGRRKFRCQSEFNAAYMNQQF